MKRILFLAIVFVFSSAFVSSNKQLIKTQLFVTVLDDIGNHQVGATVTLFKTQEDYDAQKNGISAKKSAKTDKKGRVRFVGLDQTEYYILAKKGKKDNTFKGEKVDNLVAGKMNRISVVIE